MKFLDRLGYFGFGVALGCALVYFMLIKDREFPAWMPGDRVIEELTSYPISIEAGVSVPYSDSLLVEAIKKSKVNFDKSDVRSKPCRTYQLYSKVEHMRLKICDKKVARVAYRPN